MTGTCEEMLHFLSAVSYVSGSRRYLPTQHLLQPCKASLQPVNASVSTGMVATLQGTTS